jgi:hypothetical protein
MMLLLGAAALVIDLASLRYDMRADRLASDAAAVAGADAIEPFSGSNAVEACEIAWDYLLLNIEDEETPIPPNCATFSTACNPLDERIAPASAPPYTFEIVHPVPDLHQMMGDQDLNTEVDGVACQRLGVRVRRVRDFTFGATIGFDTGTTDVHSVGRIRVNVGEGDVVPLVVLEPYDCNALLADGQGKITVAHFEDSPGVIVTDSDGSGDCSSSKPYIMEVQANGNKRWIRALPVPGADGAKSAILAYALSGRPGTDPSRAYNPSDLTTPLDPGTVNPADPPESRFQLYPEPTFRSIRVTRSPIDHRYNCQGIYPDYLGLTIAPCTGAEATYIDDHQTANGGPAGVQPTGFTQQWVPDIDTDCAVGSGESYDVSDHIWVNCPDNLVINGGSVRILEGNAVFDGGLELKSNGSFEMNLSAQDDYWAFFRGDIGPPERLGNITKVAQASIKFNRTFVYLEHGFIDLVGGAGGLVWTAPADVLDLDYPFEDLALWSEYEGEFELGGQSGNVLTGTFFTPYADSFVLKGQSGQLQTDAQFFTRKLTVDGFTEVLMKPDPTTSTLVPIRGVALIR